MKNKTKKWPVSPISRRLIIYVALFSVLITVITTLFQVYRDYRSEIAVIKSEFRDIQHSHQDTLSSSLWILNDVQINIELQGIVHLPDIDYVVITKNHKVLYSAGEKQKQANPFHYSFPLLHEYNGRTIHLGDVYVASSLQSVYQRLIKSVWTILFSTAVEIFAIAFIISFLFRRLVSRHLFDISAYTRSLDLNKDNIRAKLTLDRKPGRHDELDDVVDSLNFMYQSATSALEESEYNRRIFEDYARASSDWYWQVNSRFRFTEISSNFKKITGDDPAIYLGKTPWEMLDNGKNNAKWKEHIKTLESHKPFDRFEYSQLGEEGKLKHYQVSGVPVFGKSGEFEGYRGTVKEVSEIKNLEKQLIHSQKLDAVGRLAGGIAHDYNNMLNVILGNIDLLELTASFDEKGKTYLVNAREAALRSVGLTRKLLGFARTDSADVSPISVNDIITGLDMLISRSLTASIKIESRLSAEIWLTAIDSSELEDCLLNLAINARDAMPDGGVLTLMTENTSLTEEDVIDIKNAVPGDYVRISALDTGTGMEESVMRNIFEPFYTTKVKGKGTGLGLSMVFKFTERAGGFVTVQSEVGKGTRFDIYLPRYFNTTDHPSLPDVNNDQVALPSGKETILVVDDEQDMRELAKRQLGSLGYKVIAAENGDKAIDIINNDTAIDLVFCDIIMPGKLDGYQLGLEVLKIRPGLKLLMVSGYADPETMKSFEDHALIGNAVRNLLYKPYSVADLANAVRSLLDAA